MQGEFIVKYKTKATNEYQSNTNLEYDYRIMDWMEVKVHVNVYPVSKSVDTLAYSQNSLLCISLKLL